MFARRRERGERALAPVACGGLLLLAHLSGRLELLLPAVPLLLLFISLLLGVYPGCEAAVRLSERIAAAARPRARARRRAVLPRRPDRSGAQGGLLLALSLSGRAPPATA